MTHSTIDCGGNRQIRARQKHSVDDVDVLQRRKRELEQELMRLAAAIADSGHSRFVLDAMAEREQELDHLAKRLQALKRANVEQHPGSIQDFVKPGCQTWGGHSLWGGCGGWI